MRRWNLILRVFVSEYLNLRPEDTNRPLTSKEERHGNVQGQIQNSQVAYDSFVSRLLFHVDWVIDVKFWHPVAFGLGQYRHVIFGRCTVLCYTKS